MANPRHLEILKQGVAAWNAWRERHPMVRPDLIGVDLSNVKLNGADFRAANFNGVKFYKAELIETNFLGAYIAMANLVEANLYRADLMGARLRWTNFTGAIMRKACLEETDLVGTNFAHANLRWANLTAANLIEANLSGANLSKAVLENAILVNTIFEGANLNGCRIYGVSAWNVNVKDTNQSNLVITPKGEPKIIVDNLQVAQFIYLLLNNAEIRNVIDTITSKAVLILGRFTDERKAVLDALRDELRKRGYLPILFDFEKPGSRDLTETISTLAHMARFIIADITDAKSIPQELQAILPNLPSVAVQPVILRSAYEYAMFEHFKRYPWVLATYQYEDTGQLLATLAERVIDPAEAKVRELRPGV
jgi:hypothetical protein